MTITKGGNRWQLNTSRGFCTGEFISEELEARGWSQLELAEIMGRPARLVSELVSRKRAITPETARTRRGLLEPDQSFG